MAKKATDFNLAAEIRELVTADRSMTGKQVREALKKKFPRKKLNENSVGVAYSGARKKLGIAKSVRRKKPAGRKRSVKPSASPINFEALQAAKQYLAACGGDTDVAIDAVRQLSKLQIS